METGKTGSRRSDSSALPRPKAYSELWEGL